MSSAPLLWTQDLDAPLAWRQAQPISRRQFLADARALAVTALVFRFVVHRMKLEDRE